MRNGLANATPYLLEITLALLFPITLLIELGFGVAELFNPERRSYGLN